MLNQDVVKLINYFIFANSILAEGKDIDLLSICAQKVKFLFFLQKPVFYNKKNHAKPLLRLFFFVVVPCRLIAKTSYIRFFKWPEDTI